MVSKDNLKITITKDMEKQMKRNTKKRIIRIYYEADGIDEKLDKEFKKFLAELGYSCYASGYNLIDHERDLAFEPNKEE